MSGPGQLLANMKMGLSYWIFVLEKSSHTVAQVYLELTILPAHHEYWKYRYVPQRPIKLDFLMNMFNSVLPLDTSWNMFCFVLSFLDTGN